MERGNQRRLAVRKETLRTLSADELAHAAGGSRRPNNCTGKFSGCMQSPCDAKDAE